MYPLSVDELVNVNLFGVFFRDPKHVKAELREAEKEARDNPRYLEIYNQNRGAYDDPHPFEFVITEYDPETGMYYASIDDRFGKSKGIGRIRMEDGWSNTIDYLKVYPLVPDDPNITLGSGMLDDAHNYRIIRCGGKIDRKREGSDHIIAQGRYKYGAPRLHGFWYMSNRENDDDRRIILEGKLNNIELVFSDTL